MKKEYLKAVVWPRVGEDRATGKKIYKYVITGILVTDEPIPSLSGNEFLLDGYVFGIADLVNFCPTREPNLKVGDATDVLLNLKDL